jgi:hypothetical protein
MHPQPTDCPICQSELEVTRLYCSTCDTTLEGHFHPALNPFSNLTPDQVQFVLTFVRCEGRLNRLENEMSLSYPTLRNRLMEIIRAMGFEPGHEESPIRLTEDERRQMLDDLSQGRITLTDAQVMLRSGKKEENNAA